MSGPREPDRDTGRDVGILRRLAGEPVRVYFDGDCGVCSWCMRFGVSRDRYGLLTFIGVPAGQAIPPGYPPEDFARLAAQTVVVWAPGSGRVWTRHRGIARAIAALPGGALWAWPLRLPGLGWFFGAAYDAFASRRHRISALLGMGVCGLDDRPRPPPHGGAMGEGEPHA